MHRSHSQPASQDDYVSYKPTYDVRSKEQLLALLKQSFEKGLAAITTVDLAVNYSNTVTC